MNRIIYVDGTVADNIGGKELEALAQRLADLAREPIDILVHGPSRYHATKRFTATPGEGR